MIETIDFASMTQAQRDLIRAALTADPAPIHDEPAQESARQDAGGQEAGCPPKRNIKSLRKPDAVAAVLEARFAPAQKGAVLPDRPAPPDLAEVEKLVADVNRLGARRPD